MEKYGNDSEIINAYVEEIVALPTINGTQPNIVHPFFEKLRYCVQSLETLKKLDNVNGYVRMTLNKLPAIRGDLVRTDSQWKEWDFGKLVEALKGWVERNPVDTSKTPDDGNRKRDRSGKVFQTQQTRGQQRSRIFVYCGSNDHKSSNCSVTKTPSEWKHVLVKKRLCFNCTGSSHRAIECKSTARAAERQIEARGITVG